MHSAWHPLRLPVQQAGKEEAKVQLHPHSRARKTLGKVVWEVLSLKLTWKRKRDEEQEEAELDGQNREEQVE